MNERGKRTLSTGVPETPNGGKRLRLTGSRDVLSKFACPYAKADPDKNFLCWNINRKNVPGIKEHLKRLHWEGNLPPGIQLSRTWDDIFDYCFPDWGPQPRPSPYVNMFEIASKIQETKDEVPANPPPERSNMVLESTSDDRRQASGHMRENSMEIRPAESSALGPSALNKSGITSTPESAKEAPRVTLGDRLKAAAGTPLFLDSGSNTRRDGHIETRLVYPTPTPSSRYSTPANFPMGNYQPSTTSGPDTGINPNRGVPNTTIEHSNYSDYKNEEYQLIVRRYPINPSSSEPRGLRRFSFNSLDEFPTNFEIWLKEQFTDPSFNWDHWELMVPESRCRLSSVFDVRDELDFQYAAYRSFKAALYLVAKERSSTDRAW
ncbi:hypothetical protein H072_2930 [Dactylellina haptotyla CBS 200.50]|uniref:Uncharacterized protein n=1 Tax=Dactylellina haptotyla (strain CBS 200.50) TaxID=1284197 RepID=S8APW7_DACHA|nr:hypothetical protein H072_2930 [Dactylellina haptotyla CBS 200.50]